MKIRHMATGLVMFAILVSLLVTIYGGFQEGYSIERTDTKGGYDVMGRLENLNIVSGMVNVTSSVYKIQNPSSNNGDILGALASAGLGVLKSIVGIITFPFEIVGIIMEFYHIPSIIGLGLLSILIIVVAFLMLSAYLRYDV